MNNLYWIDEMEKYLQNYGWFKNRKVNINEIKKKLLEYDIFPLENGIYFLEEFCFLNIPIQNKLSNSIIEINPIKVMDYCGYLDDIEKYFKIKLMPIGYWKATNRTLYIDEKGKIYGNTDEFVTIFGNDFYHALYNILYLKPIENFII